MDSTTDNFEEIPRVQNLYTLSGSCDQGEVIGELLAGNQFRLERIVSSGQSTPEGAWYDQDADEWVILLSGSARLRFEGSDKLLELTPGDYVRIPAHCRHRVESTDTIGQTVWLALHYL